MTRPQRTRAVSLTCAVLTVSAVLVNNFTDERVLALVMAVGALGILIGYIVGVKL
jgi:hypothetical protein